MLLVTTHSSLQLVSLDVPYFADVILPIPAADLGNAIAADLDPVTGLCNLIVSRSAVHCGI